MKILGLSLLLVALFGLSALLITNHIGLSIFIPLGTLWLAGALVLILGPETITEITVWKASIKRDLHAAREIRDEVEGIRGELRGITKRIVEDAYIVASNSLLVLGGDQAARTRLEENLEALSKFAEPIKDKEEQWWAELRELFADRRR
jgi:hypothetical protein